MMPALPVRRAKRLVRSDRSQSGVALLMFVMLVFGFLALAGLAIDMGMANLTQNQMQTATDSAALEGLRLRNVEAEMSGCDAHRRPKTGQIVRLTFDDDLQPTGNSWAIDDPEDPPALYDDADHLRLGAGPGIQTPGQIGNQQVVTSSDASIWDDPVLRRNEPNKQYGDMVSGTYRADTTHQEFGSTYQRPDFEPGTYGAGSPDASQFLGLGFLVRMRRTSGLNPDGSPNPADTEPGVSYRARPIPFLFALGSLIRQPQGPGYNPRKDGITVRATSIAVARPALRASPPPRALDGTIIDDEGHFPKPLIGLYPFAVSLDFWTSRCVPGGIGGSLGTWHEDTFLDVQPDGALLAGTESAGRFAEYATSVGQELQPALQSPFLQPSGYVAVYTDVPGPTGNVVRIIGYGFCQASIEENPPPPAMRIRIKSGIELWGAGTMAQVQAWVGSNGVSARLDGSAPALTAAEWDYVIAQNHTLAYGPWQDQDGNTFGGEVSYDFTKIRYGTLLAATLGR